ncbi:MAG: glycosyltransferase [Gammaproteobacteria bacterium]|nr:glycosyltransferase [Gammaproteobacteria bacterium]MDH3411900.1 glycosyltransferase [Gammaproteobacteria bacterium]
MSVVIPCYRSGATIGRAVESVLKQTALPAEIILVDDCSGDSTLETLKGLAARQSEPAIRVLALERNSGPGAARNEGWRASSKPYLALLDHDDTWHPRKLEIQYGWMKEHPDVALTGHRIVKIDEGAAPPPLPDDCRADRISRWGLLLSNRFETSSVMMRNDVPARFDISQQRLEDYLLWLDVVLRGRAAWRLEMPLAMRHKAAFGEGGLSERLWTMEKWELNVYRRVWKEGLINFPSLVVLFAWSLARFARRVAVTGLRMATAPARWAPPSR